MKRGLRIFPLGVLHQTKGRIFQSKKRLVFSPDSRSFLLPSRHQYRPPIPLERITSRADTPSEYQSRKCLLSLRLFTSSLQGASPLLRQPHRHSHIPSIKHDICLHKFYRRPCAIYLPGIHLTRLCVDWKNLVISWGRIS